MFTGLLIQKADVYRRQTDEHGNPKTDRFGQPTRDEQYSHSLPCRVTSARGGERMQERSRDVIETTHTLYLEAGADIREDDVVEVKGPEGGTVVQKAQITLVRPVYDGVREHHREVSLSVQRQSQ